MKKTVKLFFVTAALISVTGTVRAAYETYYEDFESYNIKEIGNENGNEMTVTHPTYAGGTLATPFIKNAPGGIYEGDDAYTANAAENVCAYAQLDDNTVLAVFGGLNNGFRGWYNYPCIDILGSGGANPQMIKGANKVLAVVENPSGSGKVLRMAPKKNEYVNSVRSYYAKDVIPLAEQLLFSTDIYLSEVAPEGFMDIELTKGYFDAPVSPLENVPLSIGRELVYSFIRFAGDGNMYRGETEICQYEKNVWYTVEAILLTEKKENNCIITLTNKATGQNVSSAMYTIDFDFKNGVTGVSYDANAAKNNNTTAFIDNVLIDETRFTAELYSAKAVSITGGSTAIKFNMEYDEETVTDETVTVWLDGKKVEGTSVSLLTQGRVRISLPDLIPDTVYSIHVDGVKTKAGMEANCTVEFLTENPVAASAAKYSNGTVSYKVENNSSQACDITVMIVGENNDAVTSVHYKKLTLDAQQKLTDTAGNLFEEKPEKIYIYFTDSIKHGMRPVADRLIIE